MNERRSKIGAEDMLASIRRLVADEVRAGSEPLPSAARLLLTPALRVDPGQLPPKRSEKIRPLRTVLSERRAALAARGGQVPLLLSEDFAVAPETLRAERAVAAPEAAPAPLRLVPSLAAPLNEGGGAAAAETPPASQSLTAAETTPGADFLARLAELESLLDAQDRGYDLEEAQLEEGIGPWLTSHAGALSGVPFIDLGLGAEASAPAGHPQAPAGAPLEAARAEGGASNPGLGDEAQVRALIRDVLREELEGPMGERVTRNLRKLIRSELARAFASRGLS